MHKGRAFFCVFSPILRLELAMNATLERIIILTFGSIDEEIFFFFYGFAYQFDVKLTREFENATLLNARTYQNPRLRSNLTLQDDELRGDGIIFVLVDFNHPSLMV